MKVLNLRRPIATAAVWATALTFSSLAAPASAQVGQPNLIPAKSAYVISVPDSKALWGAWSQNAIYTSFKKVMDDPEVSDKLKSFNKELSTIESVLGYKLNGESLSTIFKSADIYIAPGDNAGAHSVGAVLGVGDKDKLNKLLDLAEKAAAEAVSDTGTSESETQSPTEPVTDMGGGSKKAGAKKSGSKAKSSDESDGKGGADDTDTKTSGSASSNSPISQENYSGVTVKRFASGEDNEIYYALAGDSLLVSNDRGEMKALIDRSKASGTAAANTLGSNEGYKKISAALTDHKGEVYVFGSQSQIMEMQAGSGMDAIREFTQKISPVDFYGSSMQIQPKQISSYSYGLMSGNTSNSLLAKYPGDKPLQAIKYVPAETLAAFATSLADSQMIYDLVSEAAGAAGSKGLDDQLKSAEPMLGFSIKNDLIPALGNEMAAALNSVKFGGGSQPDVDAAIVFSVRDKAKLEKVLTGVKNLATNALSSQNSDSSDKDSTDKGADDESKKGSKSKDTSAKSKAAGFKEEKVGETTIYYAEAQNLYGMTPGYAIDGDFLVIGSTKEAIKSAMEVKKSNKSIADSEAIKALGPRITTTGNMFQYFNFTGIWKTAEVFTQMLPNPTIQKVFDAVKVLKTAAGVSAVKDGAVISEGVLLLE